MAARLVSSVGPAASGDAPRRARGAARCGACPWVSPGPGADLGSEGRTGDAVFSLLPQLLEFDREPSVFRDRLHELDISFPPR